MTPRSRRARRAALVLAAAAAIAGCSRSRKAQPPPDPGPKAAARAPSEKGGVPPRAGRPRVPASPEALLGRDAVVRLQRALVERGLLGAHEEGRLDPPTSLAIRRFQRDHSLADTGFPDRETLRRLDVDPEAAYGQPGEEPR